MTLERLGDEEGWTLDTSRLSKESVVYSFGVGQNVSFDLELIRRFGCKVYAFDPDPVAVAWVAKQELPPEFIFEPIGLGTLDGVQRFYDALTPGGWNMSTVKKNKTHKMLPVKLLATIMQERNHTRLDVLKVDIEGAEFAVFRSHVPADQLLVEIHTNYCRHGVKGFRRLWGRMRTWRLRLFLWWDGFACALVHDGRDYTFVRTRSH